MKRLKIAVVLITLAAVAGLFAVQMAYSGTLEIPIYYSEEFGSDDIKIEYEPEGICEYAGSYQSGENIMVKLTALSKGKCDLYISLGEESSSIYSVKVGAFGIMSEVYSSCIPGIRWMTLIECLYFTALFILLIVSYFRRKREELYSYSMIFIMGLAIFLLFSLILFWTETVMCLLDPSLFTAQYLVMMIRESSSVMVMLSVPIMLIFAAFLVLSNLSLVRHEGMAVRNLLGAFLAVLLIGGSFIWAEFIFRDFSGSELEGRIHQSITDVYTVIFAYLECLLIGTAICSLSAARRRPDPDIDYIIILGCGIREDGTLFPLLKGRVDNAVGIYRSQLEKTGKAPYLVPSGGQGPDEVCSEAEAMKNYLIAEGIPEEHILTENRSSTTLENMKFSKALIESRSDNANVAFSTTNYHVFRSGIWAQRAGLKAHGSGSRTKWYFWPNALLREMAGLFAEKWKSILLLMIIFTVGFVSMNWIM